MKFYIATVFIAVFTLSFVQEGECIPVCESGGCACLSPGYDVCKCTPAVVRPAIVPKPNYNPCDDQIVVTKYPCVQNFGPSQIIDVCSLKTATVTPAIIPKIPCSCPAENPSPPQKPCVYTPGVITGITDDLFPFKCICEEEDDGCVDKYMPGVSYAYQTAYAPIPVKSACTYHEYPCSSIPVSCCEASPRSYVPLCAEYVPVCASSSCPCVSYPYEYSY